MTKTKAYCEVCNKHRWFVRDFEPERGYMCLSCKATQDKTLVPEKLDRKPTSEKKAVNLLLYYIDMLKILEKGIPKYNEEYLKKYPQDREYFEWMKKQIKFYRVILAPFYE